MKDFQKRLVKFKGSSALWYQNNKDKINYFDLIYIDGSHYFKDVLYDAENCWKFLNGDVHQSTLAAAAASSSACADLLLLPKIFSFLAFPSVNKEANMTKAAKKKKLFKSILNGFACFRKMLDL